MNFIIIWKNKLVINNLKTLTIMKELRFLFLVLAICLASGVKAQFYDSADDIYYYVEDITKEPSVTRDDGTTYTFKASKNTWIFNFDGRNACVFGGDVSMVKDYLKENPNYYEEAIETKEYDVFFSKATTTEVIYKGGSRTYKFSKDRKTLTEILQPSWGGETYTRYYNKVDKSYFKVGRSRTPSNTLHE